MIGEVGQRSQFIYLPVALLNRVPFRAAQQHTRRKAVKLAGVINRPI
jgi:hypothetical protein